MPRTPVRYISHGDDGGDFHETIDTFDSQTRLMGDASASVYPREVSQTEKHRWKREDAARDKRRRPPGFTAPWPDEM